MSDEKLRELERRYNETRDDHDLLALLHELRKREPLPCPGCGRHLYREMLGDHQDCSWCGTRWNTSPTAGHIQTVQRRIQQSESNALGGAVVLRGGHGGSEDGTVALQAGMGGRTCSIITCAERAWNSPLDPTVWGDMCLGHMVEYSDRHGLPVPPTIREDYRGAGLGV